MCSASQLGEFSRRDLSAIFLEKSCSANDGKFTLWLAPKDIIAENLNWYIEASPVLKSWHLLSGYSSISVFNKIFCTHCLNRANRIFFYHFVQREAFEKNLLETKIKINHFKLICTKEVVLNILRYFVKVLERLNLIIILHAFVMKFIVIRRASTIRFESIWTEHLDSRFLNQLSYASTQVDFDQVGTWSIVYLCAMEHTFRMTARKGESKGRETEE